MKKILVVEDEAAIRELVCFHLNKEGFQTLEAGTGGEAMELLAKEPIQLAILDWMLPEKRGLEICQEMNRNPQWRKIPVIMLTARSEELDKVVGLETGADDYITKPFSPREMVSRVRAVLRRNGKEEEQTKEWNFGSLRLNFFSHQAELKGKKMDLSPKEFELLKLFVMNAGKAFSRQEILEKIWGYDYFGETRTVDVHIRHLRVKLAECPEIEERLETVRNVGYRLRNFE